MGQTIVWTPSCPDRLVQLEDGRQPRWFSGTDYLGLAHFEPFQNFLKDGIVKVGTHYGSSRNNTVRLSIYEQAEELLAQYMQLPKALTVSSGMLAGQVVIQHLSSILEEPYHLHYAPQVHPALTGDGYVRQSMAWNDWATQLITKLNATSSPELQVVVTDATGSPWVQAYDFSLFNQLQRPEQLLVLVDDSHGIGITGVEGRGIGSILNATIPQIKTLVVSSLNKALGVGAGVIAGDTQWINRLTQIGLFAGASPMAPFYGYALVEMLRGKYYIQQYQQLQEKLVYLQSQGLYNSSTWTSIPSYPAFCAYRQDIHEALMQKGIVTSCFAYPTKNDPPVMRLVINAAHTEDDLNLLLEALGAF